METLWILILTIRATGQHGMPVTAIDGFKTRESCLAAANAWLKQMSAVPYSRGEPRALCVRK